MSRVRPLAIVGLLIFVGVFALWVNNARKYKAPDVWLAARAAGDDLQTRVWPGFGPNIFDIQAALNRATRRDTLRVAGKGQNAAHGDQYEVTNSDGRYPVCLVIYSHVGLTSDAPTTVLADVTDGPCPPPGQPTSTTTSTSTGAPSGSSATPTALRT
jgi:hypothetical protein